MGSRVGWARGATVGVLAFALAGLACSAPSIEGDELPIPGPRPRQPSETRTDDAPLPAPPPRADAGDAATVDASGEADAGAPDASPTPPLCTVSDLVLCMPFDGAVADKGPNRFAPTEVANVTFGPGKNGMAAQLDATSVIRLGASPSLDVTHATIEAWITRAPGASGDGVVFDADNRFSLTIEADGDVKCKTASADVIAGKVATGVWTHVACTFDGSKLRVYIDGTLKDTDNGAITPSPGSGAAIGGNAPAGEPFLGAIDSLRVFSVARSAAEIAAAAGK
ncbi:MAG: LamG domain-containing protein [Deltaproteobacteria bacterium]|nr:LamG domain-containing protein [Deltaproteobacteria bacterium]